MCNGYIDMKQRLNIGWINKKDNANHYRRSIFRSKINSIRTKTRSAKVDRQQNTYVSSAIINHNEILRTCSLGKDNCTEALPESWRKLAMPMETFCNFLSVTGFAGDLSELMSDDAVATTVWALLAVTPCAVPLDDVNKYPKMFKLK